MDKKTKIIATISDKHCEPEFIRALYEAGMNAARINSAHLTPEGATTIVENVRKVSEQIAIIIDTKGPEIRITGMAPGFEAGIPVSTGDIVRLRGTSEDLPSNNELIYLNDGHISRDVPAGSVILVDDGELELYVREKRGDELVCEVRNGGVIYGRKSVNIPGVAIDLPSVTERDARFINWAIDMDVDFIAHSFVRKKEDVLAVKELIKRRNSSIKIISKIENKEGVDNIDEILDETYGIMVARGDLGVEIPAEQIPVAQRLLVSKCIESKKPVIIATQMLHTMITHPRPTRAEISDVANAIYQRVDAVMLSGETANGEDDGPRGPRDRKGYGAEQSELRHEPGAHQQRNHRAAFAFGRARLHQLTDPGHHHRHAFGTHGTLPGRLPRRETGVRRLLPQERDAAARNLLRHPRHVPRTDHQPRKFPTRRAVLPGRPEMAL